jgi:hypothetical protein
MFSTVHTSKPAALKVITISPDCCESADSHFGPICTVFPVANSVALKNARQFDRPTGSVVAYSPATPNSVEIGSKDGPSVRSSLSSVTMATVGADVADVVVGVTVVGCGVAGACVVGRCVVGVTVVGCVVAGACVVGRCVVGDSVVGGSTVDVVDDEVDEEEVDTEDEA